jgi:branched-chain amino acid transport system permease protein
MDAGADRTRWSATITTGLMFGGIAVFLAAVGVIGTFAERQIIVGVVSLGQTMLLLTGLAAGYQASRWHAGRPIAALVRGAVAGFASGVVLAVFAAVGTVVNLRTVLISASPELFALLTFGRGLSGVQLIPVAAAVVAAVAAAIFLLPEAVRRWFVNGLAWILVVGLFRELLQLTAGDSLVGVLMNTWLFDVEGLSVRGAVVVFAVTGALGTLWRRRRIRGAGAAALSPARRRAARLLGLVLLVALLLLLPLGAGPFLSQVLVLVGLFALLGFGLNIVVGFAGMLDLGYVAFFAIGAYVVGLLTSASEHAIAHLSFWTAVPIAMAVSMIAGVVLGIPVLKTRGDYLAIVTLGFGEIIRLLVLSDFLRPWLGGSQGVLAIPKPVIGTFEFKGPEQLFFVVLGAAALLIFVGGRLRDSRLGRAWMAVREDEDVAAATGINLVNVKLLAFGLGAAFGGLSGAIFAVMLGSVFPHSFNLLISINVLALIIVGGMGSLPGVVVGALAVVGLPELLREFAEYRFLFYGAALVVMMQLRPEGLWPEPVRRRELHAEGAEEAGDLLQPRAAPDLAERPRG